MTGCLISGRGRPRSLRAAAFPSRRFLSRISFLPFSLTLVALLTSGRGRPRSIRAVYFPAFALSTGAGATGAAGAAAAGVVAGFAAAAGAAVASVFSTPINLFNLSTSEVTGAVAEIASPPAVANLI